MYAIDASLMSNPAEVGAMAADVEAAGFDGAYAFEGQHDPFMVLAAAAATTERMQLMTSIAVAFARNPMSLAYQANDLQLMSQGRFILGLGTQVKAHIERRFNMPWSKPAARMREMVLALKEIWRCWETGERLNFEGEFYSHTLMAPTFSPGANPHGTPPIYIAGVGPLMTKTAAEVAEGLFVHPFGSARSLAELTMPAVNAGLEASGNSRSDFTIAAQVITATGTNEEELEAAIFSARNQIGFYASTPAYLPVLQVHGWESLQADAQKLVKAGDWNGLASLVDDKVLNTFAVVGEPATVAAGIHERLGATADRVSPVVYSLSPEPLRALLQAMRA
jgi:probable F420-dependent oxidoreductase